MRGWLILAGICLTLSLLCGYAGDHVGGFLFAGMTGMALGEVI